MLRSGNFWVGVIVGVGGVWAYHQYKMRKSGGTTSS